MGRKPVEESIIKETKEEHSFINYVQQTIKDLEDKMITVRGDIVYPVEVDRVMATYTRTGLGLLSIQAKYIELYDKVAKDYDLWYSEKFVICRDKLAGDGRSKTKFPSQKEIECQIKHDYKEEYNRMYTNLLNIQHKKDFLKRLIAQWDKEQWMVSGVNDNLKSERKQIKLGQEI
jgi:hypothetical protein